MDVVLTDVGLTEWTSRLAAVTTLEELLPLNKEDTMAILRYKVKMGLTTRYKLALRIDAIRRGKVPMVIVTTPHGVADKPHLDSTMSLPAFELGDWFGTLERYRSMTWEVKAETLKSSFLTTRGEIDDLTVTVYADEDTLPQDDLYHAVSRAFESIGEQAPEMDHFDVLWEALGYDPDDKLLPYDFVRVLKETVVDYLSEGSPAERFARYIESGKQDAGLHALQLVQTVTSLHTPDSLYRACRHGVVQTACYLIDRGVDVLAVPEGRELSSHQLLRLKDDPDIPAPRESVRKRRGDILVHMEREVPGLKEPEREPFQRFEYHCSRISTKTVTTVTVIDGRLDFHHEERSCEPVEANFKLRPGEMDQIQLFYRSYPTFAKAPYSLEHWLKIDDRPAEGMTPAQADFGSRLVQLLMRIRDERWD